MNRNIYATLILLAYFLICGILGIVINTKTKLPQEVKRKLLHSFGFLSYGIFMYVYNSWVVASIVAFILGIGTFVFILLLEKYKPSTLTFFQEREPGEMKYTILMVFFVFAITLVVSWGLLKTSIIGTLAIMGWGFGDMFASIIGKKLPIIQFKFTKKSLGGSIACFISLFVTSLIILVLFHYSPLIYILFSLGFGLVGALIELFSFDGLDTVLMPIGLMLFSFILYLF